MQADSEALLQRLLGFGQHGGADLLPEILSWWSGELRWGRNRVTLASDRRDVRVRLEPRRQWEWQWRTTTNQLDDASLQALVRDVESAVGNEAWRNSPPPGGVVPVESLALPMPRPALWSDATYNLTAEARGEIARALVAEAEAQGLLSAGYLEVRAGSRCWLQNGERYYVPFTQAQCSMTVRDPQGTGSGWAGLSSYDWGKIDAPALAKRALEKCVASRNPVALEPGRYTVILEPQAVADLLEGLVHSFWRWLGEATQVMFTPFNITPGFSKLGLKIIDERLTLGHDPMDPDLGILPEPGTAPVNWIEHGVLTNLAHNRTYSLWDRNENWPVRSPESGYRLSGSGPTTSIEEMIATTQRGLLVTRFSGIRRIDIGSVLSTGLTRDGLWLIENGKITKPVKNMRFTESPLFVLNQIEQLGVPVPVFRPADLVEFEEGGRRPLLEITKRKDWEGWITDAYKLQLSPALTPALVPPLKARDFSFTALADAV